MSKIIAICNQKGGTGKTTSAVNISSYLALAGKKILLIDMDSQANATSGLGIDKKSVKKSIYCSLLEDVPLQELIRQTQISGLSIVPANTDLSGCEVELVGVMAREYRLKKAVQAIKDDFDLIFIDCPPSLGLSTINALCAADSVCIPVQCEYYALEGLGLLLNTISLVRDNLNSDLSIEGVILTMADFRTNLTREVIGETRGYFISAEPQVKVYSTIIPRNIRLSESPGFGKPIVLYDKDSLGAKKYWELSREMFDLSDAPIEDKLFPGDSKDVLMEGEVI
ncbi:MAG: sporulation initiation inhibitor Soj [Candidatus Omnitrophica bacterium CG11_big_fil_rev_8_21_14_0_20_42_13]|uniref:Sporulation initiation inhibitor Soj n=1 Tax=Candidatus Ghiorseimicrobium undicola TaxID=1974746 RepID=A0A2H0LXS9_9BACT|nr:MAG: sporulation initiation inhibitor Soj [Candidatus Omnitrophica bacterium CG11_big_fil_rev_8_21_14_0_20_42_13]